MRDESHPPTTVISHANALRAIRYARCRYGHLPWRRLSEPEQRSVLARSESGIRRIDDGELLRRGFWDGESAVDCLVSTGGARRPSSLMRPHLLTASLPEGSLMEVSRGLYATSPEITFLQYAQTHTLEESLALAYELCGGFSLSEQPMRHGSSGGPSSREPGYLESEPATCKRVLERALSGSPGMHGVKAARVAARYALDGARSPAEAIIAGQYHTPQERGGFGIVPIELNRRVDFTSDAQAASGMPYAVCDAYIDIARATMEYNGGDHDSPGARIHDERRAAGLAVMGIVTFSINYTMLRDIESLEAIARALYRRAGKQYRVRTHGYRPKQIELLNGLRRSFGLKPC